MNLKNKLRILLFNILGHKNIDGLRYLKFSHKFGKFSKIKDKNEFIRKFSKFYEPEMATIPKILHNPQIIIDIGANYGPYSFFFSKLYPKARIFAFEPATSSYDILNKIIRRFDLDNVIPVKKGLGEKEEEKEIIAPLHYTILAYISDKKIKKNKEDNSEEVKVTTLDSFIKRNKIQKIDFIKCDVEGFELSVFRGAKKTLKKFKPMVFVEIEERHTQKYDTNPDKVIKFFKRFGYGCYSVRNSNIIKTNKIRRETPLYIFSAKDINL